MESTNLEQVKKPKRTFIYSAFMFIYVILAKTVFRMKIVGRENVPQDENYIIMGNHQNMLDALTLAMVNPKREIHYMGKKELFNNKFLAWIFTQVHAFPVDRGGADIAAMRTALKVIKNGDTLGIFPEGTRSKTGEMLPLLGGAALLALKSGVKVVPVYIHGNYRPFRRMRVIVGKPLEIDDLRVGRVNKDACDMFNELLSAEFKELKASSELN